VTVGDNLLQLIFPFVIAFLTIRLVSSRSISCPFTAVANPVVILVACRYLVSLDYDLVHSHLLAAVLDFHLVYYSMGNVFSTTTFNRPVAFFPTLPGLVGSQPLLRLGPHHGLTPIASLPRGAHPWPGRFPAISVTIS